MIETNLSRRRWSPSEDDALAGMAGLFSPEHIADQLGKTPHAVRKRARRRGIPLCLGGPRARVAPVVKARALSMIAAGQPLREVAQAVGVSHVTVWRWQQAAMENA